MTAFTGGPSALKKQQAQALEGSRQKGDGRQGVVPFINRYPKRNSALDILLNGLLGLFSYLVPKDREQVLLGSLRGCYFRGNPKYLYLHLVEEGHSELRKPLWVTASARVYEDLLARGLPVVRLRSLPGFWAVLRSRALVISHSIEDVSYFQYLPGRFCKVHAYHGLPLKGYIPDLRARKPQPFGYWLIKRERQSNAMFVTTSPYTALLERGFLYPPGTVTGYPRNDVFFEPRRVFHSYRAAFELDQYDRVVLYCPTFRDFDHDGRAFTSAEVSALQACLASTNTLMLVSAHHLDAALDTGDLDAANIVDISNRYEDIQDLLPTIDLMVTDYSSIALDFMISDRPVIFYCYDYEQYAAARGFLVDYFEDLPGPFCRNAAELCDTLYTVGTWSTDSEYRGRYDRLAALFHGYRDGRSSERLAAAIASGT